MRRLSEIPKELRLFAKYHLKRRVVDYPAPELELGLHPLDFDFDRYVEELRNREGLDIQTRLEVDYEGKRYPVLSLSTQFPDARSTLLVLAGVHGNEYAGLLAVAPILDALAKSEERRVNVCVLTPVNPVGAAKLSRYNANGFDINRDFRRFETPEARVVRDVFFEVRPDFVASLHEGPQDATFLFANWLAKRSLIERLLMVMEQSGTPLAKEDYFGRRLEPAGYNRMSTRGRVINMLWDRTLQMKSTLMWTAEHGVPEITIESSWRSESRDERVRGHVAMVGALIQELAEKRD